MRQRDTHMHKCREKDKRKERNAQHLDNKSSKIHHCGYSVRLKLVRTRHDGGAFAEGYDSYSVGHRQRQRQREKQILGERERGWVRDIERESERERERERECLREKETKSEERERERQRMREETAQFSCV